MALGKFYSLVPNLFWLEKLYIDKIVSCLSNEFGFAKAVQLWVGLLLYFFLCFLYSDVVVPDYSFGGFYLAAETQHELVLPALIVLLLVMPANAKNMNSLFLLISFYFLLLPSAVLCGLQGNDFIVFYCMSLATLGVCFFSRFASCSLFNSCRKFIGSRRIEYINFWVPFFALFFVLALLAFHVNFALRFSFSEIYDYRFEFNESLGFPLSYLLPFAAGPLAGFLSALSASRREWGKIGLVVFCGIAFFGFSTHKANLFFPFLAVVVYFAVRSRVGLFYGLALIFVLASMGALIAEGEWRDIFGAVFANRLVFIPAQIHYVFFDEFSKVGFLYWAESKVGFGLFISPLPIASVNYIGEMMTGDARIGANVGWIANGYMNLGLIGIFLYGAILGLILALIDRWSRRLGAPILVAAFSGPVFNIVTSNDLLVSMLTGGVLMMLVLIWFLLNWRRLFLRLKNVELTTYN